MKNLTLIARLFYCAGIIGIGVQQFYYSDFRPVLVQMWPSWLPTIVIWAWITGIILIFLSGCILLNQKAASCALLLGGFLLFLFLVFQVPYELFVFPYTWHLGVWTNPLKSLALSGGGFAVAGSYASIEIVKNRLIKILSRFIPYGKIFFSVM